MQKIKQIIFGLCSFIPAVGFTQAMDNTAAFSNMSAQKYVRFNYDNDFFARTDYYYSQGIAIEAVHLRLKKFPLTNALLVLKNSPSIYGISIEHNAFTPTDISDEKIIFNDRPFAACLMINTFSVSVDTIKRVRLSSALTTGMIGPAAFGAEMQKAIHRSLKSIEPRGWQNQIRNDVIINYELGHEKQLYAYRNFFLLNSSIKLRGGTLADNAQLGFTLTLGKFNSPFTSLKKSQTNFSRSFGIYLYSRPAINFIAYDATLHGGVFNRHSPYTVNGKEISRIVFQTNSGLVITWRKMYIEYYLATITKEIKKGKRHAWIGVRVGVGI